MEWWGWVLIPVLGILLIKWYEQKREQTFLDRLNKQSKLW